MPDRSVASLAPPAEPFFDDEHPSRFREADDRLTLQPKGGALPSAAAHKPADLDRWLRESDIILVSARSLSEFGVRSSTLAMRNLMAAGCLQASGTRGVYWLRPDGLMHETLIGDGILAAHLHGHPDSSAMWGPRMAAQHEHWTARPYYPHYCLAPRVHVPSAFSDVSRSRMHRWSVKSPPIWYGLTPAWRYETDVVYAAARPGRYPLEDLHDYLWELAQACTLEYLLAELEGQPRAVWMRTCVLLRYGDRYDLADETLASAPRGQGPYYFVDGRHSMDWHRSHPSIDPIYHPDLHLYDYAIDWLLHVRSARYGSSVPGWVAGAYECGRPDGRLPERIKDIY